MNQELSNRLKQVASYVPPYSKVADIGCDHAYLPIYLVKHHQAQFVIGSEIAEGPLNNGRDNVRQAGLTEQIDLRYGSGVDTLTQEDNVDVLTIAGMGGKTITSILADGLEKHIMPISHVVLQPNTDEWLVRFWLWQHGYRIEEECILEEKNNTYEIIAATYVGQKEEYTREDILFGPYLRQMKNNVFTLKYKREADNLRRVLSHIPSSSARHTYIHHHLVEIEAMLDE